MIFRYNSILPIAWGERMGSNIIQDYLSVIKCNEPQFNANSALRFLFPSRYPLHIRD